VTFTVRAMQLVAIAPVLAVAMSLAMMVAPRAASADPPDARPSANADSIGRTHFQRGQKLSANGQYAAAYREFAAGYAATKRPLFLFNMAEAARANGDTAKARDAYLEFLRTDPKSALAATARTRLAELERRAGTTSRPEATSSSAGSEPSVARPDPPPGGADASGARPDGSRPAPGSPGSTPSISTGPPTEPIPFMPPSVTRPQPSAEGLPPERFTAERRDAEERPLWKKWPFWAVVGGVVAGGVVVFAVTRDHGTVCGPGCSEIDFRPPR
jgi:hypothetical protein